MGIVAQHLSTVFIVAQNDFSDAISNYIWLKE